MSTGKLLARLLVVLVALACTPGGNRGSPAPAATASPAESVGEAAVTTEQRSPGAVPSPTPGEIRPATSTPSAAAVSSTPAVLAPLGPGPTPKPGVKPDRVVLSGVLAVRIGDPPPGSSLPPRENVRLTDKQGKVWTLTFDDTVYRPLGSLLSFNLKRVNVEGTLTAKDTVLVTSMALDP